MKRGSTNQYSPTNMGNRFIKTFATHYNSSAYVLNWAATGPVGANWGDKLNPYLARVLSDRPFTHAQNVIRRLSPPIHYWVGSHLAAACEHNNSVVWGSGFISRNVPIKGIPGRIHAVRGWKSVTRLREAGIDCPDIVGDAALLLPRIYIPRPRNRRYKLGIVPHYLEQEDPFFEKVNEWEGIIKIDITGEIEDVIDLIVSCDRIASSSLHGLICADAYGIPNLWLHSTGKLLGDGFKFHDYFSSVGRSIDGPLNVNVDTTRAQVEDAFKDESIDIDLDALWEACPVN